MVNIAKYMSTTRALLSITSESFCLHCFTYRIYNANLLTAAFYSRSHNFTDYKVAIYKLLFSAARVS